VAINNSLNGSCEGVEGWRMFGESLGEVLKLKLNFKVARSFVKLFETSASFTELLEASASFTELLETSASFKKLLETSANFQLYSS
jgi:hypothetical protein